MVDNTYTYLRCEQYIIFILISYSPLGVSKAILDGAGQTVEAECQNLSKQTFQR